MIFFKKSDSNRRKFARVEPNSNEPIQIQLMGTGFLDILNVLDVSEGGVRIKVPHKFQGCDINKTLEMIITLPHRKPFKGKAKIKHISATMDKEGFFGVEFLALNAHDIETIKHYVNYRLIHIKKD